MVNATMNTHCHNDNVPLGVRAFLCEHADTTFCHHAPCAHKRICSVTNCTETERAQRLAGREEIRDITKALYAFGRAINKDPSHILRHLQYYFLVMCRQSQFIYLDERDNGKIGATALQGLDFGDPQSSAHNLKQCADDDNVLVITPHLVFLYNDLVCSRVARHIREDPPMSPIARREIV